MSVRLTAAVAALLLSGCIADGGEPAEPRPQESPSAAAGIRLGDISVGGLALAQRAGLYICGDHLVASAPAGGIEGDSFVVFDIETGSGEVTEVDLPRGMRPNARWLLTTQCVRSGDEQLVAVSYQEMPLTPLAGSGVRAVYTLDGEQLWMRDDLNMPATVVDDVLVLGSAPDQPETAVDLRTGRTIATFDPAVQSRTVVAGDRMVVRGLSGPPVLTTLTGDRIATLEQASAYTADGNLLYGSTPASLPDARPSGKPTGARDSDGLTDASPSPSPTQSEVPRRTTGLSRGLVRAYSLRTGQPRWQLSVPPDPLGLPTVEPRSGTVVLVDVEGVAHGVDPVSGRQQWRTPTELQNPRVTAAGGVVMFDKVDDQFQKLVDARTGLPLPEPTEPVVDLQDAGALQIIDGVATVVPIRRLRNPPTLGETTD